MKGKHAAKHSKQNVKQAQGSSGRGASAEASGEPVSAAHPAEKAQDASSAQFAGGVQSAAKAQSASKAQDAENARAASRGQGGEGAPARTFDMNPAASTGNRILKGFLIFFGILIGLVLAVYLGGIVVFMGRFYPNTTMGTLDVSLKSDAEAAAMLADYVEQDYSISIKGDGLNLDVSSDVCSMSIDAESVVSQAISENEPWLWPLKLNSSFDVTEYLQASCNDTELGSYLEQRIAEFNETARDPQDATIVYNDKAHRFAVKPEVAGTKVSAEAVMLAVIEAVSAMEHSVSLDSSHLVQAAVKSDDESLAASLEAANNLLSCDLKLTLGGQEVAVLGPDVISGWVSFADDGTVSIDASARDAWVSQTVDAFSTVGKERTYTRPDGKQVTVNAGTYGWSVDADSFALLVAESVESGATGSAEIPCFQTGNGFSKIGDWGAFCDVDLSEQHARFYDASGTMVWEADIVSGAPGGDATPTGVYMCNNKMRNINLKGPIDPETDKPKWDSPVAFWIPFVGNLIGLHDASWQPAFGGTLYANGYGSHGCVNLPYNAAASIYDLIQLGDPVIVHW